MNQGTIMEDCLIIDNIDYSMERHFVRTFIRKARRERLILQLTTPKRRYEALDRFCHQAVISLDAVLVIGSTFALVYGEPVKGGREKYLLSE